MTTKGLDFRATLGYVSDPTDYSPMLGEAYPHTYGNGLVAGISSGSPTMLDRNAAADARIAGLLLQLNDGTQSVVTVQVTPGTTYDVHLMLCDAAGSGEAGQYCQVKDGATVLFTSNGGSISAPNARDATGALVDFTTWNGTQDTPVRVTPAGSTLTFTVGNPLAPGNGTCLAMLSLVEVPPATPTLVAVTSQPVAIYTETPFTVIAQAQDGSGNPGTAYASDMTLTMTVLSGSATLSGTLTRTPVGGASTFSGLSLVGEDRSSVEFTITASGLTDGVTTAMTVYVRSLPCAVTCT